MNIKLINVNEAVNEEFLQNYFMRISPLDDLPVWTKEHIDELLEDFYVIPKESIIISTPIEYLNFSNRTYNCLKRNNINFISDLLKYTQNDLEEIKNLGNKSIREINVILAKQGLSLNK